ncbi:hypothetical protein PAXRUDRAFT_646635 [Paxillus rubicundulus Ve08.2h10]|uniref:Uncharacterized protein n=1 Tax=Paxillus rubicundulus Ve08.2h10 TaxID=930991 RepID=A0A0D0DVE7_9AGAM|nr:hypothetical protein PAXRUDRAFT_646635 [Paxillus rubicundulus Ve08.2h10]
MSNVINVSNKFGEYMLKGWVLTDCLCPAPSCRGVPLLRSPKAQEPVAYYCANCDGPLKIQNGDGAQSQSSSTASSTSHGSRPSTPPTEFSSTLSSPTFAPPVETEETIRRRQQSDQASTEIGKCLLKGWAMLGEECPNSRCYGVPLVRPPKSGSDKDPRKECVVCGTVYVTDETEGWQRLVPVSSGPSASNNVFGNIRQPGSSNKGKSVIRNSPQVWIIIAERCLPGPDVSQSVLLPALDPPLHTPKLTVDLSHRGSSELRDSQLVGSFNPLRSCAHYCGQVAALPTDIAIIDAPTQALELALGTLSERLSVACANTSLLDPSTVAATADAIGKVAHALAQVKQLQQYSGAPNGLV